MIGTPRGAVYVLPMERPPLTMNDLRRKASWRSQQRAHDEVRDAVWLLAKQAKTEPFTVPVVVSLTWEATKRVRRDPDALGAMMKGCLDGLTAAGVLSDDSATEVAETRCAVRIGQPQARITLMVTECEWVAA